MSIPIYVQAVAWWRNCGATNILSSAKPEYCRGLQLVLITGDITPVRLEIEGEDSEVVAALHAGKFLHQYAAARASRRLL